MIKCNCCRRKKQDIQKIKETLRKTAGAVFSLFMGFASIAMTVIFVIVLSMHQSFLVVFLLAASVVNTLLYGYTYFKEFE